MVRSLNRTGTASAGSSGISAQPPYRQIAAWLRSRIEAGEFRPGEDPLPSEKDLIDLFGVARDTARRAVAALREEGLVETVPQRGTYVVPEERRPRRS